MAVYQAGAGSGYSARNGSVEQGGTPGIGGLQGNGGARAASGQAAARLRSATAPDVSTADFDGDGINDSADACPSVARGANDANADGCPDRSPVLADSDGDGIPDTVDACPSVPAGATDTNGDGCPDPAPSPRPIGSGGGSVTIIQAPPPPPEQIHATISFAFSATKTSTTFAKLQVAGVPGGAIVTAACKGTSCPKAKPKKGKKKAKPQLITFTKKNAFDKVTLSPWLKKKLKVGTVITITVTKAGMIGQIKTVKIQSRRAPIVGTSCLAPGAKAPSACAS